MQIRTQTYAELAYPLVVEISKNKSIQKEYRTQALNLPTMILQSGLMQTVGFLMAKNEARHIQLLNHLVIVLGYAQKCDESDLEKMKTNREKLHNDILCSDVMRYQCLTRNAIEASGWLKRYTEALLEKDKKQEQNNDSFDA